jgi:hypothetical protein
MMTNAEIAREWRQLVTSPHKWQACANQAGAIQGEAGGFFVECSEIPRRGYLKPAGVHGNAAQVARAAREKIAADLALDLGLPVPPAVLTVRDNPPAGCEAAVVVSLVMYPRQWAWEHVRTQQPEESPKGLALAQALAACGPMLAFDTWLQQTDHGDHPHNIVWGYDPAHALDSRILFLDFAFSMGFQGNWAGDGWRTCTQAPFPPLLVAHLDRVALTRTIVAIEKMLDDQIQEVVQRIPPSHLPDDQKKTLCEGLLGRRSLVAPALKAIL